MIINRVTYGKKRDEYLQNNAIVDRLFWWYAEQDFPTERFDDLSPLPKQVKVKAMSPLCHTSVSKWSLAAGVKDLHDQAKIERCAKVSGEVVYFVTTALNMQQPAWARAESRANRVLSERAVQCPGRNQISPYITIA